MIYITILVGLRPSKSSINPPSYFFTIQTLAEIDQMELGLLYMICSDTSSQYPEASHVPQFLYKFTHKLFRTPGPFDQQGRLETTTPHCFYSCCR